MAHPQAQRGAGEDIGQAVFEIVQSVLAVDRDLEGSALENHRG